MAQGNTQFAAILATLEQEVPLGAKVQRCNDGILTQLGFIVGMPMQVVLTIAVPVQQHAVKVHTGQGLDALFEVGQTLVPRIGVGVDARIGVRLARIAIPAGQAR